MKSMNTRSVLLTLCLLATFHQSLLAESAAVDFLRSTGKIYSVVAVVVVIFIGIVLYLRRIDKKLTKLENQIKDEQ